MNKYDSPRHRFDFDACSSQHSPERVEGRVTAPHCFGFAACEVVGRKHQFHARLGREADEHGYGVPSRQGIFTMSLELRRAGNIQNGEPKDKCDGNWTKERAHPEGCDTPETSATPISFITQLIFSHLSREAQGRAPSRIPFNHNIVLFG
ncbi:MAG: hypothetical protein HS122_18275 [Opitutaceae bacterium]|nr:hypothetical protein [Opitutaceae bacterium]